jgi:hypothetical protein
MMWRMDRKSIVLGAVLGAGLCVLIGAARNELAGPVGRFQVCCSENGAYLVDTITGQVWLNSERSFRGPKLKTEAAAEQPAVESPVPTRPSAARTPTVESPRTPAVETPRSETRPAPRPAGFVGKWILNHPTQGQFGIEIEPDGRAVLTLANQKSEGKWQVEGNQITITTDRESVTAQLDDQDRLLVKQGEGEPIAFQRSE